MVSLEYIAFEHNNAAAELVKLAYDTPPLAFVHSYGCQQNVNDGERIKGVLMDIGYGLCDKPEDADLILFNTCAVREHAEQRVFGNVGALKGLKEKKHGLIIGLCGCMANQKHVVEKLRQSYPYVDLVFVVLLLLRNSPEEEGTYAFGTPKDEVARMRDGLRPTSSGVRYDRRLIVAVLKNPTTYRYSVVMIFWYCWYMTYSSYLVASVQEAGFPVQVAALAVSAASLGCVTGSFVWSPLTDRFGRKGIFALVMAGAGLGSFGLLFFLNSGIANMAAMLAVVFCMGIFAASTPVMESSLAEHYRPDMRGIGPGIVSTFSSVGRFCGPLLAALVMMALGSTQSYLYFSGGAAIVCSLAILIMVRKTGGIYGDPLAEKALREQDGSEAT